MNQVYQLGLNPAVAIFGSARLEEDHPHYQAAYELAKRLSTSHISVCTGGGPGIMEAANKGAMEGHATSVGFKIQLPFEDKPSTEAYHHITFRQDRFHYRQTALIENAQAYAAFLGGAGTEFEVFNVITLMQCGFLKRSTILLYDTDVWYFLEKRMQDMATLGTINEEDLKLIHLTDDLDEMYERLKSQVRTVQAQH